ncbi:UPF0128 family protein [Thermococcus peptonophilus]|uniref:UPF0128 family protein n=1 Tax=Thermococcus peptonophilus TaxID=53952 RepID=UPI003467600D
MLEGYYIVENTGVVPAERRFKFKDLKAWGLRPAPWNDRRQGSLLRLKGRHQGRGRDLHGRRKGVPHQRDPERDTKERKASR